MTVTSMYYLEESPKYQTEKPYFVSFPVDHIDGAAQTNISQSQHADIHVSDVRGHEADFTLDRTGFQLGHFSSKFSHADFDDFEGMKEAYFAEVEAFVMNELQATFVKVFDCDIRRRSAEYPKVQFGKDCQPVQMVHVDYSYDWGLEKARKMLASMQSLRPTRIQEITVWRPLKGPTRDWPLAVCDYRSIDQTRDAVRVDQVYPNFLAENINFHFNPAHKWYFVSDQQPHEAWMIRIMDTDAAKQGHAANCPHTAFQWHDAPEERSFRESIEVRAFVIHEQVSKI